MAYKTVLHLERVTIFHWNPTVCMPKCCPRTIFSSTHYSTNQGVARFSHHIKLNTSFRKDIAMWQIFLDHWNGSNFFLESKTTQSPDLNLFLTLLAAWGMALSSTTNGSKDSGCPSTILIQSNEALPGKNSSQSILLAWFGSPMVRQANTPLVR